MEKIKAVGLDELLADEDIIALYWHRDERAITETDKKYGKYLFTIAYNIVRDSMDCEECLNDTYLSTWNQIPPTKPTVLQIFLSKIMRNTAIDKFRESNAARRIPTELTYSLDELGDCIYNEGSLDNDEFVQKVSGCLNSFLKSLSRRDTVMFICRYYYSDSVKAISQMFKVSERTVLRALSRLRYELKEKLEREVYGNEQKQ